MAALRQALPGAALRDWSANAAAGQPAADYAIVWRPPPELIRELAGVRAVFNLGAGVDAIAGAPSWPQGVPLIRVEDAGMAEQMIEYVTYAVLRCFREIARYEVLQRERSWLPLARLDKRAFGVGVLGMGVLGSKVAAAIAAFGFPVSGCSRQAKSLTEVRSYSAKDLLTFLATCRVLVCMLPLTPATRGLLDRRVFSALPRGAYVVNVARGDILVEQDLLDALGNGGLSGAMLDVFAEEPLPVTHPFWRHPAITITPHISAVTQVGASAAQIADKIRRIESGLAVSGVVDAAQAY
ncbi:MAG: glyoxylate/hydroxypyruvate reductase A [Betaproteobacteria bacterium]